MSYNPNPYDDTSYNPRAQYRADAYDQRAGGYQVASGQSYFPDQPRDRSPSPPSHPTYDQRSLQRQRDFESQRGGYGVAPSNIASRSTDPRQTSQTHPARKPLPVPPAAAGGPSAAAYEMGGRGGPSPEPVNPFGAASPQPAPSTYSSRSAAPSNPFLSAQDAHASPYESRGASPVRDLGMETPNRPGALGTIDPMDIEDDDDPFPNLNSRHRKSGALGAAVGAGAGIIKGLSSRDASGQYGQVPGGARNPAEKSEWLSRQTSSNKRVKWMVSGLIVLVIVLAVAGGVIGAVVSKNSGSSADDDPNINIDSPAIQALMNNENLHKVFYGMSYVPVDAQYPACLQTPPLQADVTKDIALLSQLTPRIRLYGTDCDQTEMVLKAIENLELKGSMKIWLGIYLDDNPSTNARQTQHAYRILKEHGTDPFEGVIVGNEVVFSGWMTYDQLGKKVDGVREQLRRLNIELPLATSALGSNWTDTLAEHVDVVMANVHPFFGGLPYQEAADWTWQYWQDHDVFNAKPGQRNLISEMGWPSQGGHDDAAVASIEGINTFMNDWVCEAMTNGTEYFWFEFVDEPWKAKYNTKNEHWEPHWGLFDTEHNLKSGVTIPYCNGQTASL